MKNCTKQQDQDSRYRKLSDFGFSEEKVYTQNGITDLLNKYADKGNYFVGPDV